MLAIQASLRSGSCRLYTARAVAAAVLASTALAAFSPAARANPSAGASPTAPWEKVGVYEGRTLYYDPTTARKSGSRVQVFVLTDLKEANATARGRTYWSKKALLELDCNLRTLKVMQDTWYPRKMAQGEPVFMTTDANMAAIPVQSETSGDMFLKAACGRR